RDRNVTGVQTCALPICADRRWPVRARTGRRTVPAVRVVTMAAMTVRVLVVDDDPLVRSALVMMLDGAEDIVVAAEVEDGADVPEIGRASCRGRVLTQGV